MFLFLSLDTLHICSMKGGKKQYFFDQEFSLIFLYRSLGMPSFQVGAGSTSLSNECREFMNWSYKAKDEGFSFISIDILNCHEKINRTTKLHCTLFPKTLTSRDLFNVFHLWPHMGGGYRQMTLCTFSSICLNVCYTFHTLLAVDSKGSAIASDVSLSSYCHLFSILTCLS